MSVWAVRYARVVAVSAVAVSFGMLTAATAVAAPAAGNSAAHKVRGAWSPSAVAGSYLVALKHDAGDSARDVEARANTLSDRYHGRLGRVWTALHGFSVSLTAAAADALANDPSVDHVTADQLTRQAQPAAVKPLAVAGQRATVTQIGPVPAAVQDAPPWGLDRIDQHALPLDQHYSYDNSAGQGVHVYLLAGGVDPNQPDLAGRVVLGPNFVLDQSTSADCSGFGTQEAGVIAGTVFGVAKKASVVSVRIAGCNNVAPVTSIVDGFDWVINNAIRPAVIMFPLGDYCITPDGTVVACPAEQADEIVNAQESAFAAGIAVVAAAGDSAQSNCVRTSGSAPDAIYVGATTQTDAPAAFSDFGPCLTMWAPGDHIATDAMAGGQVVGSGTVFAAAHVAGAVALLFGAPEFAGAGPSQIRQELVTNRSTVVDGLGGSGSPHLLLFTGPTGVLTVGDPLGLAPSSDGRLLLLGVTQQGRISQQTQTAAGSMTWSTPVLSATTGWKSVGAQPNGDARVELAGITSAGQLWDRSQVAGSALWTSWTQLTTPPSGLAVGRVDMAHNLSNRMQMFVTDQQGNTYRRAQTAANSTSWGSWTSFNKKLRSITAETGGNNQIVLLGLDDAGRVWQNSQTSATDDNWTGFTQPPGFGMAAISAARNSNGSLELIGVDTGGNSWHRTQTAVGSTSWTAWAPLSLRTLRDIIAQTDNGKVHLVGVDNLGQVWQTQQSAVNSSTYDVWTRITGITVRP